MILSVLENNLMDIIKISVLICCYNSNKEKLIRALESVKQQKFIDDNTMEFIIVLDGKNDKLKEIIINTLQGCEYKIIEKVNTGLTDSLNVGLNYCRGDLIARIDDDDVWLDEKINKQLNIFNNNQSLVLCGTGVEARNSDNQEIWSMNQSINPYEIRQVLKYKNPFCHSSVIFKRLEVLNIGSYDSVYKSGQDYNLWVRLVSNPENQALVIKDKYVIRYNSLNSISMLKRREQKFNALKTRLTAIKNFGPDINSTIHFLLDFIKILFPYKFIYIVKRHGRYK